MPLRGKDQIECELRVGKESPNTLNDVTIMELEDFTSDNEILSLERGCTGQLLIDDLVKFFARVIR